MLSNHFTAARVTNAGEGALASTFVVVVLIKI
jgi:hypothetical protein